MSNLSFKTFAKSMLSLSLLFAVNATAATAVEVNLFTGSSLQNPQQLSYVEPVRVSQVVSDAIQATDKLHSASYQHQSDAVYWQAAGLFAEQSPEIEAQLAIVNAQLEQIKHSQKPAVSNAIDGLQQFIQQSVFKQRLDVPLESDYHLMLGKTNPKLSGQYWLTLPAKPANVYIIGAVAKTQNLPFKAMTTAKDFLAATDIVNKLGQSDVWVISPDGEKAKQGIAQWNKEPTLVLPGSIIFVPFKALPNTVNNTIADLLQHRVTP